MKKIFLALLVTLGYCQAASAATVPPVVHLSLNAAIEQIEKSGLKYKLSWSYGSCRSWEDGWVSDVSPRQGTKVKDGSIVLMLAKNQKSCLGRPGTSIP